MTPATLERITLAGGCFWCLEAVYERVRGVHQVENGYSNGHHPHPNYEQVCSGNTGHAEVVRIDFDPAEVSLRELLEVFFTIHDPTTLNRQGADVGTQYRSGIYWHSEDQRQLAAAVIREVDDHHGGRVVTELQPETNYHPAEAYHQHYYARHPDQGYCAFVVAGKVDKFLASFKRLVK
ncbi:MAG: peptide-methionine (S)-S-oxide reductase MsrA [Proteobacteria bacterium]|jgi:peptide-methionine (S)-S-oxide reductase|uniref:peptide-methionine (S)-S-oxide reductase MsrA n=1 Tax=Roseateles sp. TaxID=1971397 RepID=UPI000FC3AC0A|nr:peptide-methionine (S)-S-oxide reductase [Methylibium sp.]MBY0365217.1 peptide-methionine (S)-S-oxide reductase MsrA [Burkholderiaceae bacterium]MCH8857796.1 peptide-methionine (S)-S-oxide reductase MsrA [Pseudomonadota bacterium]RTL22013.1 MAG: peptide-methionine (S)-S-oxide reductase [Burkholderiales bacterium]|mmetsp:Transcript_5529/g.13370  ORF Transcript_5529/g.13370 Transcript_5529/m.13370 type:complete len:179 (-) Transcript_5529:1172-1708(-)